MGRDARVLGNGLIRLVTLLGGGHIAELRFDDGTGLPTTNPMWEPPWPTMEPYRYRPAVHDRTYGSLLEGKLLSGIAGHNLCLDYFGPPSAEEAAQGLSQHGEAPSLRWRVSRQRVSSGSAALGVAVKLPVAGLQFTRDIELRRGESVAYIQETVRNERKADHFFSWTQHVSLGTPFLSREDSVVAFPGTKGMCYPHAYNGNKDVLIPGRRFEWPRGPRFNGGKVDLTHPWIQKGRGLVAGILLDPRRKFGYVAALNRRMGLLIVYCFRREDFPWVALWEENRCITAPPWRGKNQSRGLEFSTLPLPVLRREAFNLGPLFGRPTLAHIPARGTKTVRYVAALAQIPADFSDVKDVDVSSGQIVIHGPRGVPPVQVAGSAIDRYLSN